MSYTVRLTTLNGPGVLEKLTCFSMIHNAQSWKVLLYLNSLILVYWSRDILHFRKFHLWQERATRKIVLVLMKPVVIHIKDDLNNEKHKMKLYVICTLVGYLDSREDQITTTTLSHLITADKKDSLNFLSFTWLLTGTENERFTVQTNKFTFSTAILTWFELSL